MAAWPVLMNHDRKVLAPMNSLTTIAARARLGAPSRVLSAACLSLTLVAGIIGTPEARAAAPNPLPAMLTALADSSAFQVTYIAHSTETPPANEKLTLVLVRRTGVLQVHTLDAMRPSGAGEITIVENVSSGAVVCSRVAFNAPLPLTGKYACGKHAKQAQALAQSAEPVYGLLGNKATVTFARAAARMVGGVRCAGYRYVARAGRSHGTGAVYVAPSGLPCEEDADTFAPAIGPTDGKTMATIKSVTIWSRVGDRRLNIPAGVIPANTGDGSFAVQPAVAKVGGLVTLSGRTKGGEFFVPPFVQMVDMKLHTVTRPSDVQCGGTSAEPVAFGQVVNSGPYMAKGAPAGKAWRVTFRIPTHLSTYGKAAGGNDTSIPTPPGVYRLVASFGPAFFCPSALPTAHGKLTQVSTVTVLP